MPESLDRLGVLGLVGGLFYLLLGASVAFFVGRYLFWGAPGPFWVSLVGGATVLVTIGASTWLIRSSLQNEAARRSAIFRHLTAGAFASVIWAPYEIMMGDGGFIGWALAGLAFFGAEAVAIRWLDQLPSKDDSTNELEPGSR